MAKIAGQYDQLMLLVLEIIKSMERRANKHSARVPGESSCLLREFGYSRFATEGYIAPPGADLGRVGGGVLGGTKSGCAKPQP